MYMYGWKINIDVVVEMSKDGEIWLGYFRTLATLLEK